MPKRKQSDPASEPAPAQQGVVPRGIDAEPKERLSIPLLADGSIDFDSMRTATRDRLKNVLANPATKAGLGLNDAGFTPGQAAGIYEGLGRLEVMAAAFWYPPEVASAFGFTSEEKALLAKPTAEVLNKRATGWMRDNADLLQLGILFGVVHHAKFERAAAMMAERKKTENVRPAVGPNGSAADAAEEQETE